MKTMCVVWSGSAALAATVSSTARDVERSTSVTSPTIATTCRAADATVCHDTALKPRRGSSGGARASP